MTIGSWTVGQYSTNFTGLNAAKIWSGADGRTIPGRVSRKSQWNSYSMSHRASQSGPMPLTIQASDDGVNWTVFTNGFNWASVVGNSQFDGQIIGDDINGKWSVRDEYALLAKLLAKVKSHSYNVGVSLAEVDKFSSGVVSTLNNLGRGVLDLSRGDFTSFARRFGASPPSSTVVRRKLNTLDVSGRFLEMRYAWTPAIQDVFSAAEAFEALSNGPRQQVFKVSRKRKSSVFNTGLGFGRIEGTEVVKRTYTYEAYEELGAFRQMGLGNPASILWERIPYSFVVDWFIPIGTYLELIGQIPFLKGRFLRTDSIRLDYDGPLVKNADGKWGGWKFIKPIPSINSRHFTLQRTTPSSLSVPKPTLKVEGSVQGKRVQNAIALTHQVFARALHLQSESVVRAQRVRTKY